VATNIKGNEGSAAMPHTVRVAIEIERKFILSDVPGIERLGPGTHIRQGYLTEDEPVEVRVRITDVASNLTVKAGAGLSRTEVDIAISVDDAEALWPHTVGRRVDKTRHRVTLGVTLDGGSIHHVAEVDIYSGTLAGLHVAEVEFTSETDAGSFNPPDWFGPELTGDPAWSNAALARQGRPDT
jgi:CYTH domain-containing protein